MMSRRNFIRSLSALAALAVAPAATARKPPTLDGLDQSFAEINGRNARVTGKVFHLHEPIVFDLRDVDYLAITNCSFVWCGSQPLDGFLVTLRNGQGARVFISDCYLNPKGGGAIRVDEPTAPAVHGVLWQ